VIYQVWEWNGRYIRGNKVGKETHNYKEAISHAKDIPGFKHLQKEKNVSWIEDKDGNPVGLIEHFNT
jgi:hypothetical protein